MISAAAAKSLQSCLTLSDPIDGSPPGSPCPWDSPGKNTGVGCHVLLQCMKVKSESEVAQSCPTLATPWTAAHQAPPSMGFSRQEYWSGVPLPSPKWSLACCILLQSSSYQPLQKQGKLLGRWWKSYDGSQTIMRIHLLLLITTVSRHI